MYKRDLEPTALLYAQQFPVVAILGPRQSGKTTLAKKTFASYDYVSLENIDIRRIALEDPRGFLESFLGKNGVIIDEFQEAPELLSYMQGIVDSEYRPGFFILTGSQNYLMNAAITQTLAGRIGILTLLPLSMHELRVGNTLPDTPELLLYKGSYPRIYAQNFLPQILYPNYIQTYVERDIRQLINVANLSLFQTFVQLCAGRIGQIVNLSSLANDCGISVNTAKSWLSLLEASYIIFLLQPYYKNFNKRLIKSPKLYFYDTGLACSLLGVESEDQVFKHYLRGSLFESLIISELLKTYYNKGLRPHMYFWRDNIGNEIDCIIEKASDLLPIEIKAGKTIVPDFYKGLEDWKLLTNTKEAFIVYGGKEQFAIWNNKILPWNYDFYNNFVL